MGKLSVKGFWGFTALIFVVLFLLHRRLYVMPDAVSTAGGTLIGTYLLSWGIWWLVRWRMKERAPDSRWFIVVLSAVVLVITNIGNILALLK